MLIIYNVVKFRMTMRPNLRAAERRQRERDDLRRAILDAARDLFVSQGYEAVTMRKIADAIDYTPTAIYYHFKDKEEILRSLVNAGFTMLAERLHGVQDPNPVTRLRRGGEIYLQFAFENPQYYTIMFEMQAAIWLKQDGPEDAPAHAAFNFVVQCVAEGMALGEFRDDLPLEILSHIVLAATHGAVSLRLSGRLQMLPPEMHDAYFAQILDNCIESLSVRRR